MDELGKLVAQCTETRQCLIDRYLRCNSAIASCCKGSVRTAHRAYMYGVDSTCLQCLQCLHGRDDKASGQAVEHVQEHSPLNSHHTMPFKPVISKYLVLGISQTAKLSHGWRFCGKYVTLGSLVGEGGTYVLARPALSSGCRK